MKLYNRYILVIAVILLLTTVVLIAAGQTSLQAFYSAYVIEALVVTELYIYFNSKARRGLNRVSAVLTAGFLIIVLSKIAEILIKV